MGQFKVAVVASIERSGSKAYLMMARWFTVESHRTFCGDTKGLNLLQQEYYSCLLAVESEQKFVVPTHLVFLISGVVCFRCVLATSNVTPLLQTPRLSHICMSKSLCRICFVT